MKEKRKDDFMYICDKLREVFPTSKVGIPSSYNYTLTNKNLILELSENGLKGNLQDNGSAFESWAIVLKYYLHELIDSVTVEWKKPMDLKEGRLNYNRFLYRVLKFSMTYDWVRADTGKLPIPSNLVCNCPNGKAAEQDMYKVGSEGEIESKFVETHKKEYDVIDHQFPVGIFDGIVSNDKRWATGGKSGIDIWAIKDGTFSLFELKKPGNKPLGIISEIMFYTNVINDVVARHINYDKINPKFQKAREKNYRSFDDFYKKVIDDKSINTIKAVLLAEQFHPLIEGNEGLMEFINDSDYLRKSHISYSQKHLKCK